MIPAHNACQLPLYNDFFTIWSKACFKPDLNSPRTSIENEKAKDASKTHAYNDKPWIYFELNDTKGQL